MEPRFVRPDHIQEHTKMVSEVAALWHLRWRRVAEVDRYGSLFELGNADGKVVAKIQPSVRNCRGHQWTYPDVSITKDTVDRAAGYGPESLPMFILIKFRGDVEWIQWVNWKDYAKDGEGKPRLGTIGRNDPRRGENPQADRAYVYPMDNFKTPGEIPVEIVR